jgi:hypothetical protein
MVGVRRTYINLAHCHVGSAKQTMMNRCSPAQFSSLRSSLGRADWAQKAFPAGRRQDYGFVTKR